mmetsp:Transcript_12384/g.35402  ORF Transcript_12384/g.35402 Transcript_12384/m.35402 type:complete len:252 (-) Transcript_12384:204-959(-)
MAVEVPHRAAHVRRAGDLEVRAEGVLGQEEGHDLLHLRGRPRGARGQLQVLVHGGEVLEDLAVRQVLDRRGPHRQPPEVEASVVAGVLENSLVDDRRQDVLGDLVHGGADAHDLDPRGSSGLEPLDRPAVGPSEVPVQRVARRRVVQAAVRVLWEGGEERAEPVLHLPLPRRCGGGGELLRGRDLGAEGPAQDLHARPVVRHHRVAGEKALDAHHRPRGRVKRADADLVGRGDLHEGHLGAEAPPHRNRRP